MLIKLKSRDEMNIITDNIVDNDYFITESLANDMREILMLKIRQNIHINKTSKC
jgi:hypothetical protein